MCIQAIAFPKFMLPYGVAVNKTRQIDTKGERTTKLTLHFLLLVMTFSLQLHELEWQAHHAILASSPRQSTPASASFQVTGWQWNEKRFCLGWLNQISFIPKTKREVGKGKNKPKRNTRNVTCRTPFSVWCYRLKSSEQSCDKGSWTSLTLYNVEYRRQRELDFSYPVQCRIQDFTPQSSVYKFSLPGIKWMVFGVKWIVCCNLNGSNLTFVAREMVERKHK